jgi:two-component system, NtrC family, sensor kinase
MPKNIIKLTWKELAQAEKLSAIGRLAVGVTHQLNSPLTGLISLLKIYKNKEKKGTERYEDFSIMLDASMEMGRVIKDFIYFAGESKEKSEINDVAELIRTSLSLLRSQLLRKNIRISEDFGRFKSLVRGERKLLQLVFMNLILNACEASETNGQIKLEITVNKNKKEIVILITNRGKHIKKQNMMKIFEPYFTTKGRKGFGLGLSIVYGIIKNHGGQITVTSREKIGTVFTIKLPLYTK